MQTISENNINTSGSITNETLLYQSGENGGLQNFQAKYASIRKHSEDICSPLKTEDYVVQPVVDVSPPKWHLGHTTWFFETFILKPHCENYKEFDANFNYVFNSYYESVGCPRGTNRSRKS